MKTFFTALGLLNAALAHSQAAKPVAVSPACHNCTFSDAIDRSIQLDAELTTNPDSCCVPELLSELRPPLPLGPHEEAQSFLDSKALGWSAWSNKLGRLSWYLRTDDAPALPKSLDTPPVRLPSADGRLLYLAGNGGAVIPKLLLEFRGNLFRFIELNNDSAGKTTYQFYQHPDCDLLVLTNEDGVISKIFNSSTIWLSIFDLRRNTWLIDTVVESYEGEGDDKYGYTSRFYQVKDQGRTLVLGPYRDYHKKFQYATLPHKPGFPRSRHDLPPGTYHLVDGRYQPGPLPATKPPVPPTTRAAVGAAEVNGTYRDEQGREWAVLALGGGKLQVKFAAAFNNYHSLLNRHIFQGAAAIQADTATFRQETQEPCVLRLHFVRPGTLEVSERGAGCAAEAVGTYQKISSDKPLVR